jgi:hypothetical protein
MMGRPDMMEEIRMGKIEDWIILGPLWASVVYIGLGHLYRNRSRGRAIAIGATIAMWVAVGFVSNWAANQW